eukprot:jgi/Mesen1/4772/ME000242S03950
MRANSGSFAQLAPIPSQVNNADKSSVQRQQQQQPLSASHNGAGSTSQGPLSAGGSGTPAQPAIRMFLDDWPGGSRDPDRPRQAETPPAGYPECTRRIGRPLPCPTRGHGGTGVGASWPRQGADDGGRRAGQADGTMDLTTHLGGGGGDGEGSPKHSPLKLALSSGGDEGNHAAGGGDGLGIGVSMMPLGGGERDESNVKSAWVPIAWGDGPPPAPLAESVDNPKSAKSAGLNLIGHGFGGAAAAATAAAAGGDSSRGEHSELESSPPQVIS